MRNAKAFFQGLLRPFGARAIASQWSESSTRAQNTLLAECVHFQGLLRRCAPRAAAGGGANRHPRTTVRSILFYRSDVVLPLKTQSKKMRNAEAFFQGLLRPFGARAAFGGANRQHGHKIHPLRSVCTFRDYFVAALLVPPQAAGRTDIREQRFVLSYFIVRMWFFP